MDYKVKLDVNEIKMDLKVAEKEFDELMTQHLKEIQSVPSHKESVVEELFMTHSYIKSLKERLIGAELDSLAKEALLDNLN